MSKRFEVGIATPDEIALMGVNTFLRENEGKVIQFAFALQGAVFIKGSDVRGKVLGQMNDANGRHYSVEYQCMGQTAKNWFTEAHLIGA
jgi:hypothetical protein